MFIYYILCWNEKKKQYFFLLFIRFNGKLYKWNMNETIGEFVSKCFKCYCYLSSSSKCHLQFDQRVPDDTRSFPYGLQTLRTFVFH